MGSTIEVTGKIKFDPPNVTEKHKNQGKWKKVAILELSGDLERYYGWFIKKRFNLNLSTTLRGAHITLINDKYTNNQEWVKLKNKYNGKRVKIILDLNVRTDSKYWWLRVDPTSRKPLQEIRDELGLGLPYFGMHMTIGSPVDIFNDNEIFVGNGKKVKKMNVEHSKYIHSLIKKGFIK